MTFLQLFCFDFLRIFTSFAFDPFDPSQLGHVEHSAFATAASLLPIKLDVVPLRHGFDEPEGLMTGGTTAAWLAGASVDRLRKQARNSFSLGRSPQQRANVPITAAAPTLNVSLCF